ncbi:MAG: methyltransferase domain-containing protein [Patescibacteria group bacterium]
MNEITPPDYSKYNQENYTKRIRTPSSSRDFFEKCINPIVTEVINKNEKAILLNIGIGPGHEFNHPKIKENPNLKVIGVDIDQATLINHTRSRLPQALLVAANTKNSPFQKEFADCGVVINALMYNPKEVLQMLFESLKPDGKAILNDTIFERIKEERKASQLASGCKNFPVEINFENETVNFTAIDYTNHERAETRNLGTQIYPTTQNDAEKMFTSSGFEIIKLERIPYEKDGETGKTTVFVVQKPKS